MRAEEFQQIRKTIPNLPGVYKYIDVDGKLLYVGKAKNLRKRVSSYFVRKKFEHARLKVLIRKCAKIEFIIVDSERDALLLEDSIIKQQQPRYNVLLKDDKSYPYICIKNEPFPRVFLTRNLIRDGSEYLGPYTSVGKVKDILKVVTSLFPLRTCNLKLSPKNIEEKKFKVCLEYHIKNCLGPCEAHQNLEDYDESITQIRNILKGNFAQVKQHLKRQMEHYSSELLFEKAELAHRKLKLLEAYQSKSTVSNPKLRNIEVYTIAEHENWAFINYLRVANGAVIQSKLFELHRKLDESKADLLAIAISRNFFGGTEKGEKVKSKLPEILIPFDLEVTGIDAKFVVPQIGDRKKLIELSMKNALYAKKEKIKQQLEKQGKSAIPFTLKQLKEDLKLKQMPFHIECFDNSNIQGSSPVASVVVFKNAKPAKKEYRHYNIKTVVGPDDFASMKEVVFRRYKRLVEEGSPLPQLVVIDGGKGQLNAALDSLKELNLIGKLSVIGIAKKLEELYFPADSIPIYLDKRSVSLKLLQQLRNEAHRFAITFHRLKRSKKNLDTQLIQIEGIGRSTVDKLLQEYRSIKKMRQASLEELASHIGLSRAQKVKDYLSTLQ